MLDRRTMIELYTTMLAIRRFEERVASEFYDGHIFGFVHSYIGQEAIATGKPDGSPTTETSREIKGGEEDRLL